MHQTTARRLAPVTAAALALAAAACADPTGGPTAPRAAPRAAQADAAQADDARPAAGREPIPGHYIVVLRDQDDAPPGAARAAEVAERRAREKAQKVGARVRQLYKHALSGFAAELTPEAVAELRADAEVAYVEQDQMVYPTATQGGATWGIDRVDQRALPLSGTYTWNRAGAGVRVYIIDTGLRTAHAEFSGRASNVYDAFGGNGQDCNGHGTHVGGTVGGETYGVAKDALLRGVRVFQCSGGSANSTIIGGVDWVTANHIKPAAANLSLGGGFSQATNDAVTRLAGAGVFVAVAAGNDNRNACDVSPASAGAVMTVASSTRSDAKSSFSNWGSCVDVYAPGSSITSAWYTSNTATNTISGTSMATPHVAGVAALYKSAFGDASQATINAWVVNNATANVITGNVTGTPNRLLFKGTL
jgi:subtilisin family serine protease